APRPPSARRGGCAGAGPAGARLDPCARDRALPAASGLSGRAQRSAADRTARRGTARADSRCRVGPPGRTGGTGARRARDQLLGRRLLCRAAADGDGRGPRPRCPAAVNDALQHGRRGDAAGGGTRRGALTAPPPILLWFRRDLRLADHPMLHAAAATGRPLVPVAICDPLEEALGAAAKWRWGEGLRALADALAPLGSRLVLRRGDAAEALARLVAETGA